MTEKQTDIIKRTIIVHSYFCLMSITYHSVLGKKPDPNAEVKSAYSKNGQTWKKVCSF